MQSNLSKILLALIAGIVLFGGIVLAQSSQTNSENQNNENHSNHMQELIELHEKAAKENWSQEKLVEAMNREMQEHMAAGSDMPCHKNGGMMNGNAMQGMMGNSNSMNGMMNGTSKGFDSSFHQKMHEQVHGSNGTGIMGNFN